MAYCPSPSTVQSLSTGRLLSISLLVLLLLLPVLLSAQPAQLAVTSVSPASPQGGQLFSVTVQAQDAGGAPAAVTQATTVGLSWDSPLLFPVAGSTQAVIDAGESSTTITITLYNAAGTITTLLHASAPNGSLAATSASLSVQGNCTDYALSFNNSVAYVQDFGPSRLDVTGSITLETWFYHSSRGVGNWWDSQELAGKGQDNADGFYTLFYSGGGTYSFLLRFDGGSYLAAEIPAGLVALNRWHHLAGVYNEATRTITLYLNGEVAAVRDVPPALTRNITNNQNFELGRMPSYGGYLFHGRLNETRLWNTARSQEEIRNAMYTRLLPETPGLAGYWRLDEGTGATAFDLSGNGAHAVISTSPGYTTAELPSVAIVGRNTVFQNNTVGEYSIPDLPGAVFQWTATGGTITTGATAATATVDWGASSTGSISVSATDINGCVFSTTMTVAVIPGGGCDNTAISFGGSSNYINVPGFTWTSGGPITVEFWIKVNSNETSSSSGFMFTPDDASNRLQAHVPWIDNVLYWDYGNIGDQGRISTNFAPYLDKWTHVALVSAGNNGNFQGIYLDGVLVASLPHSDGPNYALTNLNIGYFPFRGLIDDFRIWDTVRSAAQISGNMFNRFSSPQPHLAGYWRMDEGAGTTAYDISGHNNHAVLVNGPVYTSSAAPSISPGEGCAGYTQSYSITPVTGATYSWSAIDGTITAGATGSTVTVEWGAAGTGSLAVTVATLDGCTLTTHAAISIYSPAVATAGTNTSVCLGESVVLGGTPTASGGSGSYSYVWSPATGLDNPNAANPTATPSTTTTYTVTVTGGCQIVSTVTITVLPLAAPVLSFDGGNAYAQSTTAVNFNSSSFTVEFRAKRTSAGSGDYIVGQGSANTNQGLYLGFGSSNNFIFGFYNSDLVVPPAYSDNDWHHWAGVYDIATGERSVYRDGELVARDNNVGAYSGTGPLLLGNTAWFGNPFGGSLDEVRIWNTARSQSEIAGTMHSRLSGTESGLIAYYPFEEGMGTTTTGATVSTPALVLYNGTTWISSPAIHGTGTLCSLPADMAYSVVPSAGTAYTWTVTGGTIIASTATATANTITVRWSVQTTGTVSVAATTGFCEASETFLVNATNSTLAANAGGNATICRGSEVAIGGAPTASGGTGGYTYVWSPATGLDNPYIANPTASPSTTTTYTVTVSDMSCSASSTVTVSVLPAPMQVLSMDGSGDYLSAPSGVWFSGDFTVEAWVNVRSYNSWSRLIDFGNGAGSDNILIALTYGTSGYPSIQIYSEDNSSGIIAPEPLPLNQWVHLAFTAEGGTVSMYKNGELWVSGSINTARNITRTTNYIGHSNWPDADANALFDELRIWNTARTAEQIRQAMMTPLAGNEAGLAAYYPFSDTEPVYQDEGPNGYHLTAHGDITRRTEAIILGENSLCEFSTGATYQVFTTPGETYSWTANGGTVVSATSGGVVVDWGTAGSRTLTVTAANAQCSGTGSLDVELRSYPVAAITGSTVVCPESTIQYSVVPEAGATYAWTVSGGVVTAGQTSATATVLWGDTGTGSLGVTITNQYGCASVSTQSVTINTPPAQVAITGNNDLCVNSTGITYSAPGTPGNTYLWTVNGGTITSGQSDTLITVSWNQAITGSVTFTETAPNGCSNSSTMSVKISAPPFSIGGGSCFSGWQYEQSITLTNTGNEELADYYALVTVNTLSLISQGKMRADGADIRFSDECTELAHWIDNGLNTEHTVVWVKIPAIAANSSKEINLLYGNPAATTTSSITDLFHSGIAALYTFTEATGSTVVDKAGDFDLSLSGSVSRQPGFRPGTYSLDGFSSGRAFYNGNGPAIGTGDFTAIAFINSSDPNGNTQGIIGNYHSDGLSGWVLKLQSGAGRMMLLTSQSGNWCQDPAAGSIQANTWAMVAGRRISGTNNSLFQNGTLLTDLCGGTIRNLDNSGPFEIGRSYDDKHPFQGRIALAAVYTTALSDSVIRQLHRSLFPAVEPAVEYAGEELRSRSIAGDSVSCTGSVVSYSIPLLSDTQELFQWTVTGGVIAGPGTGSTITVVWGAGTSGTLTITATNATAGCTGSTSLSVRIIPAPDAVAISGETTVCPASTNHTYNASLQSDQSLGWTYVWTVTGGTITAGHSSTAVVVAWNAPGIGSISLTETNQYGCFATTSQIVTILPHISADAGTGATVCYGESTALGGVPTASGGTGGFTYQWTPSTGLSGTTTANPTATPVTTTTYTVLVTDSFGCSASTSVTVTVTPLPSPALGFDGIDDIVSAPLATAQSDNVTMEAWIKWNGKSGPNSIVLNGNTSTSGFALQYNHPALHVLNGGVGYAGATASLEANTWYHVAATRDNGTWKLYVNGSQLAATGNPLPNSPSGALHIGANQSGNEAFGGLIDEVRIWTTARTAQQLQQNMFTSPAGNESGLAAYYSLNEGLGITTVDAVGGGTAAIGGAQWTSAPRIGGAIATCAHTGGYTYSVASVAGENYEWTVDGGVIAGSTATASVNSISVTWLGSGTGTVHLTAMSGASCTAVTAATVAINTPPALAVIGDITLAEDGTTTLTLSIGDVETPASSLVVTATSGNTSILSTSGIVVGTAGATTDITLTPLPDQHGAVAVTVTVNDGCNSTTATFTMYITPVNDTPSFVQGTDQTVTEDAGAQSVAGWATNITAGPDNEQQSLAFTTTNDNNTLFSVQPTVSSTGTLTFTPAADMNGSAVVSVYLADNGGTDNGGVATGATVTFTIYVTPVNDTPSFVQGTDQTVLEDAGSQSVAEWATAISAGPANEVQSLAFTTTNDNNTLFSVQPTVSSTGTLTFTPAANMNGSAVVSVYLADNGGTDNGGVATSATVTFTIYVAPVNDAPSFTKGADQTVPEDAGAQSVAGWATDVSAGPNEVQSLAFTTTNDNNALFSVQPTVSSTGTLTFTPAANMNGSAVVSVYPADNGGTDNGGVATGATVTFAIYITPVNDAPVAIGETGATCNATPVEVMPLGNDTDIENHTLSIGGTTQGANGTVVILAGNTAVRYTPQPGFFGSDTFTYTALDGNGGSSTATITIQVYPPVTVDAGTDATICAGQTTSLNGSGTSFLGGMSFSWSPATGLSNPYTTTPDASPSTTTTYTLTATDGFGCTVSDQVTITVVPLPDVSVSGNTSICPGGSVQISAEGGTSYSWSPAAGLDNPLIASPTASPSTTTTYTVVIAAGGCSVERQVTVTVGLPPTANAGPDVAICAGTTVQLNASGGTSYSWSPAAGLDNPFIANPTASPSTTTTYTVMISNALGCSTTDTITVSVLPVVLNATVLLEGASGNSLMNTGLTEQGLLPVVQPYSAAPFFYNGSEQLATSATTVVDWVLVELRTQETQASTVMRRAALLHSNGTITDVDGTSPVVLPDISPADGYYIVVWHRNHIAVMSAVGIAPDAGCSIAYNFTVSDAAAYAAFQAGQKQLGTVYGMSAGDLTGDGIVNAADRATVRNDSGLLGYRNTDVSLDGIVNAVDRVLVRNNTFRVSQVP